MDDAKWDWGDWGTMDGYVVNGGAGNNNKGITISARELARFCYLYLSNGTWNGQQIISKSWIQQATSPQVSQSLPGYVKAYGYNWWTNSRGDLWPDASTSAYAAQGFNNNRCLVLPEWDMVVVRIGTSGNLDDYGTYVNEFLTRLEPAVSGGQVAGASTELPRTGGMPIDGALYLSWLVPFLKPKRAKKEVA
ncbi:MAG: hypothetical protein U1C53_02720 [Candidatus Veblenbacteria bacterium]|nr:hypothetical protein [Candidatus Veblenbacteria bacterium]